MITGYNAEFYDTIRAGCIQSAEVVVPLLMARYRPRTVVDVGCGEGYWATEFHAAGCDVLGIDGDHIQATTLGDRLVHADLEDFLPEVGRFDLAVCLEVGEHLPQTRGRSFVAELCALADVVVFSAAIPHQTGAGHVNCQWPSWWATWFEEHDYGADGTLRWVIWNDDRVEPWYRQNLVVYERGKPGGDTPLDLVHPVIHEWGR